MEITQRFAKKVALVTGAAHGIGRATALRLAGEGASVALADIDTVAAEDTAAEIHEAGNARCAVLPFDAGDPESCRTIVDGTIARYGRLDVVCNIAGIAGKGWHTHEMPEVDWHRMLAINLTSVFLVSQRAIPHLLSTRGNIVNMASAAGKMGQAYISCYCATKAAVINFSKAMAMEYSHRGVRVNTICPGGVKTRLQDAWSFPPDVERNLVERLRPQIEMATPEEIAIAIAYLASDDARFVTGADFSIDGAQSAG